MKYLVFIDLYAAAIPFYFALYQAYKLIGYIDKNKAFSELSVRVLKIIKYCATIISSLFVVGMPLFYLIAEKDDAPGIILIGMALIFSSERVGITMANLSILKNGKAKAIRLSTLEAICKALECQPGDILEYKSDENT